MPDIREEIPRLMRLHRIDSKVDVNLNNGKLICTVPKDKPEELTKVREMLDKLIRERDLTGDGDKVGGVAELVSYAVNVADLQKPYQAMCNNGRPR